MAKQKNDTEKLLRESQELRETAIDMMEHAALLITKSVEIDRRVTKIERK